MTLEQIRRDHEVLARLRQAGSKPQPWIAPALPIQVRDEPRRSQRHSDLNWDGRIGRMMGPSRDLSSVRETSRPSGAGQEALRVLFVCDHNRLRSLTAERIYGEDPRLEVRSAGVRTDASVRVTRQLLDWADLIFVMERSQRNLIRKRFEDLYQRKQIVCLYIPDEYDFMDPDLVRLLRERVAPHLPPGTPRV